MRTHLLAHTHTHTHATCPHAFLCDLSGVGWGGSGAHRVGVGVGVAVAAAAGVVVLCSSSTCYQHTGMHLQLSNRQQRTAQKKNDGENTRTNEGGTDCPLRKGARQKLWDLQNKHKAPIPKAHMDP